MCGQIMKHIEFQIDYWFVITVEYKHLMSSIVNQKHIMEQP